MKKVLILGSSRKDGHTKKAVERLRSLSDFDVIDLLDYNISHYDYGHKNENDDCLGLMRSIIYNYDTLIFATPVYWYTMSGIMKVFFDRITDLLDNEKELGRKLRTKNMAVLSSSIGDNLGEKFWYPFIETAQYLGMNYIGNVHTIENEDPTDALIKFAGSLNV
ncbi:MAG: flavodoxin family protein [Ferruginibacter sp.]